MLGVLAQEGGPLDVVFESSDTNALWVILGISLIALVFAYYLVRAVLAAPEGTDEDARDREGDPGGCVARTCRGSSAPSASSWSSSGSRSSSSCPSPRTPCTGVLDPIRAFDRVHPGRRLLGGHRVRGDVARGTGERPHRQRRP